MNEFRRASAVLAWLLVTACKVSTPAMVTRIDGDTFKSCMLTFGWTPEEVVQYCGEPARKLRSLNEDETECWLYPTRTLVGGTYGLPLSFAGVGTTYAVCFQQRSLLGSRGLHTQVTAVWAVDTSTTTK